MTITQPEYVCVCVCVCVRVCICSLRYPASFRETCQWLKFPLNGLRAQSRVSPVVASGPTCLKITPILDKLLEYKRSWIQRVNRMPRNRLPRVMKHYSPAGRRNHGRLLKRLLDT